MKKALYIITPIVLVILVVAITAFAFSAGRDRDYVSIQDDGVYFGMSYNKLVKIKGQPYETLKSGLDTPFDYYSFHEEIDGYSAESTYVFDNSLFGADLFSVDVSVQIDDLEDAKNLFDSIYQRLTEYYKTKKNYYNDPVSQNGTNSYSASLGTNNGATGISVDLDLENYTLTISAFNQE